MLLFAYVSQATRLRASCARQASRTASEMVSQTLSGCPSPTDSEEKIKRLFMLKGSRHRRIDVSGWDDTFMHGSVNLNLRGFLVRSNFFLFEPYSLLGKVLQISTKRIGRLFPPAVRKFFGTQPVAGPNRVKLIPGR